MLKLTKIQHVFLITAIVVCFFIIILYLTDKASTQIPSSLNPYHNINMFTIKPERLFNITFKYILNNSTTCESIDDITAVIIVTSYFGNVETRSSMRRAFTTEDLRKYKLRRVFLLGEAPTDKYTTQQSVSNEHLRFGDLIQGNFVEAYRNLTYKHVMGLKWASTYCSNAKFIIKMDDDTVVNIYMLKTILDEVDKMHSLAFIAGYKLNRMKPIREPVNKWYVTQEEYSLNTYPSFVSGWFYITNPQSVKKLVTLANYEKYFWIDDVLVTGILAKRAKLILFDISQYFVANSEFLQCCLQDFEKNINCDIYVGPNGGDNNMFFKFNKKAKKCFISNECIKRSKPINETCVAEKKINLGKGEPVISGFRLI